MADGRQNAALAIFARMIIGAGDEIDAEPLEVFRAPLAESSY